MSRRFRIAVGLALAIVAWTSPADAGEGRVISTSLCADQFALALLPSERIVSVSRQADDPALSVFWEKASSLPRNRGSVEEIVQSDADIVISNAWGVSKTRDFLEAQGVEVVALPLLEDLDQIMALTVEVARRLGAEDRGRELLRDAETRLSRVRAAHRDVPPRALYLSPGGTTAGAGSFGHRVMTEGGTTNIAAVELGKSGWSSVGLEEAVMADPDLLVLSFFRQETWSMAQRIRFHSGFRALAGDTRKAHIPGRAWICSAWFLILAVEALADGVADMEAGP